MFRRPRRPDSSAGSQPAAQVSAGFQPAAQVSTSLTSRLATQAIELETVYARVLQSFLPEGSSPAGPPPTPPGSAPATPPTGPYAGAAGGTAPPPPPPLHAPGAAYTGPVGTSAGGSGLSAGGSYGPSGSVRSRLMGGATPAQVQEAEARAQAAIMEALGSAPMTHLTPDDVTRAQSRMEIMRAAGRLNDAQHTALSEGLAVLARFGH